MKKRILAGFVAAVLVCVCFAGCDNKKEEVSTNEKSFTYWVELPSATATTVSNVGEIAMYKEMEKMTGIKVQFIHPPTGQSAEKFNLMMASREFPDVIEYNWAKYQGGATKAVSDGVAYPLNDIMEEHAPNFAKIMNDHPEFRREATTLDGKFYGFPSVRNGKGSQVYGGLYLRKDWLDDLGLEVPETIDEWETVLRAFKEKKGAIAPLLLSKGNFITASNNPHFTNAYNVGEGYYVDDNGKVCYGPAMDVYKDYLERMHSWYEEGLLDKEFATINGSAAQARILEGESGAGWGFLGSVLGGYLNAWKARGDDHIELVGAQYPVMNKGEEPNFLPATSLVSGPQAVITTKAKNPEMIAGWLDYFYEPAGYNLLSFGVEGETYNMVNGVPTYTELVTKDPDGLSVFEVLGKYCRPTGGPGYPGDDDPGMTDERLAQDYPYQCQIDALRTWSKYAVNSLQHQLPNLEYNTENSEERANLHLDINSYAEEMIMRFIIGDESLDNFEKFQKQMKKMGLDRLLEIQQEAYDAYMAK
ncbi:MAG: extracellular solute-binding protein [Clostridia bacterium]|nr:extracellular solute-binding protein [Clostridia bacterium]